MGACREGPDHVQMCVYLCVFSMLVLAVVHCPVTALDHRANDFSCSGHFVWRKLRVCLGDMVVVVVDADSLWETSQKKQQQQQQQERHQQQQQQNQLLQREVVEFLTSHSIPCVISLMKNRTDTFQIEEIVAGSTREKSAGRRTTFLLMTSYPAEVLAAAELSFHQNLERRGSIFPHDSRWIVVTSSPNQRHDVIRQQWRDSVLDNVAVIDEGSGGSGGGEGTTRPGVQISTFMWRGNRTKELVQVAANNEGDCSRSDCPLFPNLQFGWNGRHLSSVYRLYSSTEYNPRDIFDRKKFTVSILNMLAKSMNFTYSLTTVPDWRPACAMLKNGDVDMSPDLWLYDSDMSETYSYPVIFDTYTGIYRREVKLVTKSTLLVMPFRPAVGLLLLGSFLYCIYFYIMLVLFDRFHVHCDYFCHYGNRDHSNRHNDKRHHFNRQSNATLSNSGSPTADLSPCREGEKALNIAQSLVFSIVGQPSFPHPTKTSQRIILFILSFSTVIYYALYTGVLTAKITITSNESPIVSFEEMLTSGDYRCTVLTDGKLPFFIENARVGITKRVKDSCEMTVAQNLTADLLLQIFHDLEPKTVLIFYSSAVENIREFVKHRESILSIREALRNANQGFLFPPGSEIEPSVSMHLQRLHAANVIEKLYEQSFKERQAWRVSEPHANNKIGEKEKCQITLGDIKLLAALTFVLACLSFLVLVGEWAVTWCRYKQRR